MKFIEILLCILLLYVYKNISFLRGSQCKKCGILKLSDSSTLGELKICAKCTSKVLNMSSLLSSLPSTVNFGTRRNNA